MYTIYIYIYEYIHKHTHTHVTLQPVEMLRMSGAIVPFPYAFTACTGTILATVTENFFPRVRGGWEFEGFRSHASRV